jgi:hypothetical protein
VPLYGRLWHTQVFGKQAGCQCADWPDLLFAQAQNPKDQYLLLKALNEVIVSLTAMGSTKGLDMKHQSEARPHHVLQSLEGLAIDVR